MSRAGGRIDCGFRYGGWKKGGAKRKYSFALGGRVLKELAVLKHFLERGV